MNAIIARPAAGATKAQASPGNALSRNQAMPRTRSASSDAEASPAQASSLIVLTLRPDGPLFNGNRVERAKEAGFTWLRNQPSMGMVSDDTGEEIARFVVNGFDEAMEGLTEIQLHIDPRNCAWQSRAGTVLMERLQRYSILVGGHVADGIGNEIDQATLDTVAHHIDAVMEERRDASRRARTVKLPTGEVRQTTELSYVYTVIREAGSKRLAYRTVNFEAPALQYYQGRAHGMQMAAEIVQFFLRHKTEKIHLHQILAEAMRLDPRGADYDNASTANVVSGFIEVISTLIEVGARNLNPKWLEYKIAATTKAQENWQEHQAQRKAHFAERMRAAREAAKARRGESRK